jgi:5-(carboxyamino)imidazole ribonucleotide mutase
MAAALTPLPVLGIPVESKSLRGLDSLLSIAQMPAGVPVASFPIGKKGAIAAAHFAIALFRHL